MRKPHDVFTTGAWQWLTGPDVEVQWFERKAHPVNRVPKDLSDFKEHIAEAVCGFANSNPDAGGLFVLGIGNRGEPLGIDRHGTPYLNSIQKFEEQLDGPRPAIRLVEITNERGETDHVLLVFVDFLPNRVAQTTDGRVHIRRGDQTITLKPDQAQALFYEKGQLHFEDEPAVVLEEDALDSAIVREFCEQLARQRKIGQIPAVGDGLRLARLTTSKNDQVWLTKAGLLVLHKDPRVLIPGAYVRYFRYEGRDETATQIRSETFEGPIPTVIQQLRQFMPTQLSRFTYRRDGQMTSEDEYPAEAWDEAIVNALVHRSYSQQTRPVWIKHYEDRLEVTSPGGYPLGVSPEHLVHTPRNSHLMEALHRLAFVQMAEEGIKRMKVAMAAVGVPPPRYSAPDLDRVTCTLLNDIDRRTDARTDPEARAAIGQTTVRLNVYPLRSSAPIPDPSAPFPDTTGRPSFTELRNGFQNALRAAGYHLDSFAGTAVDFQSEHLVPQLARTRPLSIYPGIEFRILDFDGSLYIVLDHTVEVRNRRNAADVKRALPWISLTNRRHCFAKISGAWSPGRIIAAANGQLTIEVSRDDVVDRFAIDPQCVIPELNLNSELTALVAANGVKVDLIEEVRKASLVTGRDAPRRRQDRISQIVGELSTRVFPISAGEHEVDLVREPVAPNTGAVRLGRRLTEPKVQFDKAGFREDEEILHGLTTYGSFEKPETRLPIVLVTPAQWAALMQRFLDRVRQGHMRFKGMEATFAVQFGGITTVIAELDEYQTKVTEAVNQLGPASKAVFLVFAPERGFSRADYNAPYYRAKRLLLEAGFPSQMVKEETLENPQWKDLNFALDIFAKAGFVPWVLSEGIPTADLFIGLSSSTITHADQRWRVIGYANVFDEFGRFLFYQGANEAVSYDARNLMFRQLLARITKEYQHRKRKLQRIHIHHRSKLSKVDRQEIAEGILAEAADAEISFVHINEHNAYRLFDLSTKADGAAPRGTWISLTPNRFLIATTGPNSSHQKYVGTPRPLEVAVNRVSARGRLDLGIYAQHVLSLTRLNWASTKSFCHAPITIKFANDIAYLMNVFLATDTEFRLHDRLKATPWFL